MSEHIIQELVSGAERAGPLDLPTEPVIAMSAGSDYVNRLSPPIDTMFFKKEQVTLMDQVSLKTSGISIGGMSVPIFIIECEKLSWRVDVYTYVTGAKPSDPDFRNKNGSVLIVFVHSGTSRSIIVKDTQYIKTVKSPDSAVPVVQLPVSGGGVVNGDDRNYSISYQETLPMFNKGGNGIFEFNAEYKQDFTISSESAYVGRVLHNGTEFGIENNKAGSGPAPTRSINGISAFTVKDPAVFPLTFEFQCSLNNKDGEVLLNARSDAIQVKVGLNTSA